MLKAFLDVENWLLKTNNCKGKRFFRQELSLHLNEPLTSFEIIIARIYDCF